VPIVYGFTLWNHLAGKRVTLAYKCTAARIDELGGEIVLNTAEVVNASEIDEDGVYLPTDRRSGARSDRARSRPRRSK
jgi:hypothetical protein